MEYDEWNNKIATGELNEKFEVKIHIKSDCSRRITSTEWKLRIKLDIALYCKIRICLQRRQYI